MRRPLTTATVLALALSPLTSAPSLAQSSTPTKANAQAFIRDQLLNGRAALKLVDSQGNYHGATAKITAIWGSDCVTNIDGIDKMGDSKSRRIDWSQISDMGADLQYGFGYEINLLGPVVGSNGSTIYGMSIYTGVDSVTTDRIFKAMTYLKEQCAQKVEGGW